MKPISEFMNKNLVQIRSDSPLADVVKLMRTKKIGAILIIERGSDPVGIFTERDLLYKVDFDHPAKLSKLKIKDVMTLDLITVDCGQDYSSVLELMKKKNIRHLPVTQDGHIIGMVSLRDMMRRYEENLELLLEKKEVQLVTNMQQIKESEERFRTIFNNSAVAITLADNKERLIAWNPLAADFLGLTDQDMMNKRVKDLYPINEWRKIRSLNLRALGMKSHVETKVIDNSGNAIDVDLSISILKNSEGEVTGSIGIMSDISKRKEIEMKLAQSLRELEDVRFALDEHAIVALTDQSGKITYANDKFCEVSLYPRNELIGQDHRIVNSGYHSNEFMSNLWKTIQSGRVWQGEIKNLDKDGNYYWVDTTIVPFVDDNGTPYQYVSIRTNITERKKYEEELELANKDLSSNAQALSEMLMDREKTNRKLKDAQETIIQIEKMATLGTLAAGFAHEIKNPLAIILQGIDRVEKAFGKIKDEDNIQYVNIVRSAALRANKVVTSLLKYSRASQLEVQSVNIYEVVEAAVDLVKNNADMNQVDIQLDYDREEYEIAGDHIMLQQVFFDLLTNAIDALPSGGIIHIAIHFEPSSQDGQGKGRYVIKVKDNGDGIDEKYLAKIFDPFFTTKDEGKGTGLGLSTVYLILERHEGKIAVESKLGTGTTFTITLPIEGVTEINRRYSSV